MKVFAISLAYFSLLALAAACASNDASGGLITSDDGAVFLSAATSAARTAIAERKTATLQFATLARQQTMDVENTTATAFVRGQTQTPAAATVAAYDADLTATADLRTSIFVQNQQTAVAHARETETQWANQTATANAAQTEAARQRETAGAQASGTASALKTAAPLTALANELAAQQLRNQIAQAQQDAVRAQRWGDFVESVLQLIVGIGSIALLTMLILYLAKYLDSLALARRIIETRDGTAMLTILNGRPSAQLIRSVPNLLETREDYFELPSQAGQVAQEARPVVRTVSGKTFTLSEDPEREQAETQRRLALRLLRESMKYYQARGLDPHNITRIATWRDLEWSADTWSRAVDLLRQNVTIRRGRGGGVFCGEAYPNLVALYSAVGERRAALSPEAERRAA